MIAKRFRLVLAMAVIAGLASSCIGADVARTIQLVNVEREARGAAVVLADAALQAKAQTWADVLASEGRLVHSNLAQGAGSGWRALGENLAQATSVEQAHDLLLKSSSHRRTMLSGRYTHVGIGIATRGTDIYVVQVFGG